jgi:hypothetical protein
VGGLDFFFCVFIWRFNGHLLIILTFVMFVSIQPPRLFFIFSFGPSRHIFFVPFLTIPSVLCRF